jgi:hypothetical protein
MHRRHGVYRHSPASIRSAGESRPFEPHKTMTPSVALRLPRPGMTQAESHGNRQKEAYGEAIFNHGEFSKILVLRAK